MARSEGATSFTAKLLTASELNFRSIYLITTAKEQVFPELEYGH